MSADMQIKIVLEDNGDVSIDYVELPIQLKDSVQVAWKLTSVPLLNRRSPNWWVVANLQEYLIADLTTNHWMAFDTYTYNQCMYINLARTLQ